jgi:hypothetical protein
VFSEKDAPKNKPPFIVQFEDSNGQWR